METGIAKAMETEERDAPVGQDVFFGGRWM
jgi:hypothetical protein